MYNSKTCEHAKPYIFTADMHDLHVNCWVSWLNATDLILIFNIITVQGLPTLYITKGDECFIWLHHNTDNPLPSTLLLIVKI